MSKFSGHDFTYNKTRFRGKMREQAPNPHNGPKIKFVKVAGQFVLSYFEPATKGYTFKQKWSFDRKELEDFRDGLSSGEPV